MKLATHVADCYCELLLQPEVKQARLASHKPEIRSENSFSTISLCQATCLPASEDNESEQS